MDKLKSSLKSNVNRLKTIANELSKENVDVPVENRKEINEFIRRYYKNKTEHFTNKFRGKFAEIEHVNGHLASFSKASEQIQIDVKELQECVNDANCVLREISGDNNEKQKLDTVDNDVKPVLVKPLEPAAKKFRLADGTIFEPRNGCITWGTQSAPDSVNETKEVQIRGKMDAALALTKLDGHVTDIGVIRCYISKGICDTGNQTELTADCPSCTKTRFIRQNARSIQIQTDASEIDGENEAFVQPGVKPDVVESEVQADSQTNFAEPTVEDEVQTISQPATPHPSVKTDYASILTELGNFFSTSEEASTSVATTSIDRQPPSVEVIEVVENGAKTALKNDSAIHVVNSYTELQSQPVETPRATTTVTQTPVITSLNSVVPNGTIMASSQNRLPAPFIYTPPQPRPPPPPYQQMAKPSQYASMMQQFPLFPSGHGSLPPPYRQPTCQPSQQPTPNICMPCAANSRLSRPSDSRKLAKTPTSRQQMLQQQSPMQNNMNHNFTQSMQPRPHYVQSVYSQMPQQPMFQQQYWPPNSTNVSMNTNNVHQNWQFNI
uniref:Caprin-1_dimer domain-containing protein n=1 Tax=Panagrellus redivivus TaxID=6233 RepID=A0A7E5A0N8_PANRE